MITQNYKIIKQAPPKKSKANKGSAYWEITLRGLTDRKTWTTYVDITMKNFPHWETILENPDIEYELGDLRVKDPIKRIVDADSKPRIVRGGNNFGNLFVETV